MTIPTTRPGPLGRFVATGALTLAVLGFSVPAASAGRSEQIITKGGIVQFRAHGEILAATDTRADGYAVRAELYWAGGKAWIADFGFEDARERSVNLSLPEGTDVKLRMCYIAEGHSVRCSGLQRAEA